MIIDILLIIIGLSGLIVASITDIRTREVPDWLNYSLICSGLGLRLIYSLNSNEWRYFLFALLALVAMLFLGTLMYYAKQWGGGDTKLLIALGVIFATSPKFLHPQINSLPFLLTLLMNLILVGGFYGLIYAAFLIFKNKNEFLKEFRRLKIGKTKSIRMYLILTVLFVLVAIFIKDLLIKILLLIIAFLVFIYTYLFMSIKAVENVCMHKTIPISRLTEGDWILDKVIRKRFKISDLGIEKYQIENLRKARIKKVIIKQGIPFVPSFLIATLISLLIGNVIFILI